MKTQQVVLGLRANLGQFALLVLIVAFVGGMVGLERTVVPLIAEADFKLTSKSVALSFIISFGLIKAFSNLFAGRFSDKIGRKKILLIGWLVGIPVPFLVIYAPSWSWIVFANVLLGVNQGLCWSTTVIMKIDLVGPGRRGLAMGLNEFSGYVFVALSTLATGYIAAAYSLRPHPFYLGIGFALIGFFLSAFFAKETKSHMLAEARSHSDRIKTTDVVSQSEPTSFSQVLLLTSWKDRALFACSQAGCVNNLNDGMAWGLFPIFFATAGLSVAKIGWISAVYPFSWGLLQLWTGALSDRWGRKWLIASGMWIQAVAIWLIAITAGFLPWILETALLGLGTALVYPTLLAAVGDVAHPNWRASAVGVYRLWRDSGYAIGALTAGIIADLFGISWAIAIIGGLTFMSGLVTAIVMYETLPKPEKRMASN